MQERTHLVQLLCYLPCCSPAVDISKRWKLFGAKAGTVQCIENVNATCCDCTCRSLHAFLAAATDANSINPKPMDNGLPFFAAFVLIYMEQ